MTRERVERSRKKSKKKGRKFFGAADFSCRADYLVQIWVVFWVVMLLSVGLSIISGGDFLWPSRVRRGAFQEEKKFRLEKIDFFFANKKNFFGVLNLFGFFREIMLCCFLLIFVSFVSCFFPPVASHCVFSRPFSGQLRVFFL